MPTRSRVFFREKSTSPGRTSRPGLGAVVSVIALQDVLYSAQIIYQRTYEVIPLLLVATLWYLVMTSVLSVFQHYIEVWFSRGNGPARSSWLRRNKVTQESES